ncbi:fibronectin type III domain-containing protein [Geomonas oryzisoli]|uniref:Fibronectin type III domain-containing protein n=1 Tax=Geomonas oryzisoli TaxID=2847992 RepID=A0ABX8J110_9BACT|nr:Ig-like domain-containing protein [Geomonas oryzisoli]QWV91833.1 fibronectin type III domain-containing protein [Geomonas oryzisoli]
MKAQCILQFLLAFVLVPVAAFPSTVNLQWDPSTDPALAGYRVYYQANNSTLPFAGTGAAEGAAPVDVSTSTTASISGLDPGSSYYFAVTAYDTKGAESVYSNVVQVKEMVPPVVAITSPSASTTVNGSVAVQVSAADNVGVSNVELYVNGSLQASGNSAPYTFNWPTASLAPGQYTLTAKAYDAAGNVGSAEEVVFVAGDTAVPTVTIMAPGNNKQVSGTVAVTASATDNVGVTGFALYDNSSLIYAANQGTLNYNWNTANAGNGSHTLVAIASDAAGNAGSASVTVTVANDLVPPSVNIVSPTSPILNNANLKIAATAQDNVAVVRMEAYVDGVLLLGTNSGSISASAKVGAGTHTVTVCAYDAAGNKGSKAVSVSR